MKTIDFAPPPLPDIQAQVDHRGLPINAAGVRGLRLPARITDAGGRSLSSVLDVQATVAVPAYAKGTHMSRFIDVMQEAAEDLRLDSLPQVLDLMLARLEAERGSIKLDFPWFVQKRAPVSGVLSLLDVKASFVISRGLTGTILQQGVRVPVTSLCPCSKAISNYGAHNQRSEVTVVAEVARPLPLDELVAVIEAQASCELYGLLKRADEKYVTERAYENPKFVEDMVRDVYAAVGRLPGVQRLSVSSENFESIHNHSAFAHIDGGIF